MLGNTVNLDNLEEPLDLSFVEEVIATITNPEMWVSLASRLVYSLVLVIIGYIIIKVLTMIIEKSIKLRTKSRLQGNVKRQDTLVSVLRNVIVVFIWFVVIMMIFEAFDLPVRTLLAGAGVIGLAIGFGAQTLVKDIITGFFILLENQFDQGDFITVNTSGTTVATGEVISMGLRSTKLRGFEGELYFIPNGTINEVINFSRENAYSFLDIAVSSEEDERHVEQIINDYFKDHWEEEETFIAPPMVLGLNSVEHGMSQIRIMLEVEPMAQWGATRRTREVVKRVLREHGIEMAVPKMDLSQLPANRGKK